MVTASNLGSILRLRINDECYACVSKFPTKYTNAKIKGSKLINGIIMLCIIIFKWSCIYYVRVKSINEAILISSYFSHHQEDFNHLLASNNE